MVQVPQVQIPDFVGTIARAEQGRAARAAALDADRFNSGLAELAPQLAQGEGADFSSALARLAGLGARGAQMALPLIQQDRQNREYQAWASGGGLGGAPQAQAPVAATGPTGGDYTARLVGMESAGDPNARNPRSSATGLGQFIDGTWLQFAAANPGLFQGMDRQQVLAARSNPELSRRAISWYAAENGRALAGAGLPVNDGTVALAHRFGAGDAVRLLRADPSAPIAAVVGQQVMAANPDLAGRTVGQVAAQYAQRFGGGGTSQQGGAPAGADPAIMRRIEMGLASPNPMIRRAAEVQLRMLQMQQQNNPGRYVEETRDIGGRQVAGQRNSVTGQFTPYPGQTSGGDGISTAQARATVLRLAPQVASGQLTPDMPAYNEYALAYEVARAPQNVWVDDPNNPGVQRQVQQPGLALDPRRFPAPVAAVQPAPATVAPTEGGAPAAVPAPPQVPAPAEASAPTRQAPNSTPTGEENLSAGFARRMVEAESILGRLVDGGYSQGNLRDATGSAIVGGQNSGPVSRYVGNSLMSAEGQQYRQAQEDWVRAKLRRESGAVIGASEMADEVRTYFPQPGDGPEVIAQKAQARRVAIEGMRQAAGRAARTVPAEGGQTAGPGGRGAAEPPPQALRRSPPPIGHIEDGHRYRGGDASNPASWERVQ